MFRRILTFVAASVAAMSLVSCEKDDTPKIEFEKQIYVMSSSNTMEIKVIASEAPEADMTIPLTFGGTAVKGDDYTVEPEAVTFTA